MRRRGVTTLAALGIGIAGIVLASQHASAGFLFDASLTKTHSGTFTVGGTGTFTLDLKLLTGNAGNDGFQVLDTLPSGLTFQSGGGPAFSCGATGQSVSCTGTPTLTSTSQSATITVVVGVGAGAMPSVTNTASFTDAFSGDTNAANNTATDVVAVQALSTSSSTTTTSSSSTASAAPITSTPPTGALDGIDGWTVALMLGSGLGLAGTAVVRRRRR